MAFYAHVDVWTRQKDRAKLSLGYEHKLSVDGVLRLLSLPNLI